MMKLCSVYKQKVTGVDKDGNEVLSRPTLVGYFEREKDEVIEIITQDMNIGISNVEEKVEGKIWKATMTKSDGTKWYVFFIYHSFMGIDVFTETLKKYKGAIQAEAEFFFGSKVDCDVINWVNSVYF